MGFLFTGKLLPNCKHQNNLSALLPRGGLVYLITESWALDRSVEDREAVKVTGPSEFPASVSLLLLPARCGPSLVPGPLLTRS